MRLSPFVQALASDLAALGELGDEATARAAAKLASAMEGPLKSRLLEALGQVASELGQSVPDGRVELRLLGPDDVELDLIREEQQQEISDTDVDGDSSARITLRLSVQLKQRIESTAGEEGISVNTYIVKVLNQQSRTNRSHRSGRTLRGYGRS